MYTRQEKSYLEINF